ncbi:mitochondrial carrier [Penicillium malachiteum]|uniref:mitochondrial carrier n=1 Tax=Penicillium malachiteum TaxID=1324776 RepID=UPI0025484093|nr:mitochondrial carrier [Penicillium malachiteum]KAJ5715036.1 mitochondrial carrier [Penicillium malachiteum]
MKGQDGLSSSFVETIAGFTAGVVTTLCLHPLDLVKTRLQVDRTSTSHFGSSLRIMNHIARNEGGLVAFYRGLAPNLVGNSTSWALYFLFYGSFKNALGSYKGGPRGLTASDYFLASGTAGALTSILTNPIWVIKTRMLATGSQAPGAYPSFVSGAKQIYCTEGIPGFYRGLVPALFGVSHGALQFMAYEHLKKWRSRPVQDGSGDVQNNTKARQLGNIDFLALSGLSKLFAGCATYPYQVIRSRLQTYEAHLLYSGATDAMKQVWRHEGLVGFYKGMGPNLLRVLPSTWVTFLVYENMKEVLPSLLGQVG